MMERKMTKMVLFAGVLAVAGCGLFEDAPEDRRNEESEETTDERGAAQICEFPGAEAPSASSNASDKLNIEGVIRAHNRSGCRVEGDADWRNLLAELPAHSCGFHPRATQPPPQEALAALRLGLRHAHPGASEDDVADVFGVRRERLGEYVEALVSRYASGEVPAEQESLAHAYVTPIMDVLRCSYGPSYVAELAGADAEGFMEHHTDRVYEYYLGRSREEAIALADDHELDDEAAGFTAALQTRQWGGRRHALVLAGGDHGLPETRLGADDLEVREGGEPVDAALEVTQLGRFARENRGVPALSVALLHRARAPLEGRQQALAEGDILQFMELLPASTTASVTSTTEGVSYHLAPTDDRLALRRALGEPRAGQQATKYDALAAILERALDDDARFQIVLDTSMSSGWDSREQCYRSVVERARAKGVPVFGAAYGAAALDDSARLAAYTDGCMVYAASRQAMDAELAELALFLNQAYVVSWESESTEPVTVGRREDG